MDTRKFKQTVLDNQNIILGILVIVAVSSMFATSFNTQNRGEEFTTSVGWYAANIKEARKKNKECFNKPEMQSATACKNSQHALEISYKGSNT